MSDIHAMADTITSEILKSGISLPPLPTTGTRLLQWAQQPIENIDISSFAKLIEADPGLYAKILQLANSPYYGSVSEIIGLRKAILQIGLEETINSVYLFFFQGALPKFPNMEGFSGKDYWAHSWACASANRMLGHPDYMVEALPGELYIAGLLHGIGKLILALYRPDDFLACIRNAKEKNQPLAQAETEIFGTTDMLIACKIMKFWHLPDNICEAVGSYQSPETAETKYNEITALTQFAYYIANMSGVGQSGDEFSTDLSRTWISRKWSSPLAEETTQKKIVEGIISTLQQKAMGTTGVAPQEPARSGDPVTTVPDNNKTPVKRNLMEWIRSLF